jgi:choline dehydrogenase-like flavoprotein
MGGSRKTMLGVMIKVKDDMKGRVIADGVYHKFLTSNDVKKLEAGSALAEKILRRAGVKPHALQRINIGAYHPGGTAAMFKVVDRDQQSSIRNLFVSDASVLPVAPGLPPMLTIMALSRRLARNLAELV